MGVVRKGRRGRPPTASPDDVLELARACLLEGIRLDVTVLARRLGLGRATIYRWFGSRDALLGQVIADDFEAVVAHHRRKVRRRGAEGLLDVFDGINRTLSRSTALRALLEHERDGALRLLTSSGGQVQPRAVAAIESLIIREAESGAYQPPTDPEALAYAIVRLAEAFLYNDAAIGIRGDHERLRQVEAALLGIPAESVANSAGAGARPPAARPAAVG